MAACSKRGVIAGARKILAGQQSYCDSAQAGGSARVRDELWGLTNRVWNEATRAKGYAQENNLSQACKAYAAARGMNAALKQLLREKS